MTRRKFQGTLAAAIVLLVAGGIFADNYSYTHPYTFHDCRRMQSLCPSHYAVWAPPGGSDPSSRYLYGACACAASITIHGG
jgi:hypothetical protein